jgi:chromosome segregation ATPase
MRVKLPFELPIIKEGATKRKDESALVALMYERTLSEYRDTLENYKRCVREYVSKLEGYDKQNMDNRLTNVQTAMDMTYLKEQQDKTVELMEDLKEQQDKTVELMDDMNRQMDTLKEQLEVMKTGSEGKTLASLESLSTLLADTNYKVEGLDKNVVNRLSELLLELQKQTLYQNKQLQAEILTGVEKLSQSVKRGHTMLWVLFVFNILGLSALAFIVYIFSKSFLFHFK